MSYNTLKTPSYREFFQKQGTAVGSSNWIWFTAAGQTDFASVTGEAAGIYLNSSEFDLDEYKWSNIFLTKGTYKITLIVQTAADHGIAELLFGSVLLGTMDMYHVVPAAYNQVWETTFTLTANTTADLRFRVNGKNAASTGYYIDFSRFRLEKTG